MNEKQVRAWFIKAIEKHPQASPELKRSLFSRGSMINNYLKLLYSEFQKCQETLGKKKGKKLKEDTYKWFTEEMADGFVKSVEKQANERMQSDLKRLNTQKETQDKKDFESTFNGQVSGDLKDFVDEGALILDESQLQRPNTTTKGF